MNFSLALQFSFSEIDHQKTQKTQDQPCTNAKDEKPESIKLEVELIADQIEICSCTLYYYNYMYCLSTMDCSLLTL